MHNLSLYQHTLHAVTSVQCHHPRQSPCSLKRVDNWLQHMLLNSCYTCLKRQQSITSTFKLAAAIAVITSVPTYF